MFSLRNRRFDRGYAGIFFMWSLSSSPLMVLHIIPFKILRVTVRMAELRLLHIIGKFSTFSWFIFPL